MKNNIILTGMPGVGKSTTGVILAKIPGYHFIDSDLVIQQQEQRLLKEIIEKEGIDGFLAIENRVNAGLTPVKSIIATGGSAVYGREAMEHFKEIGQIIYLHLDFPHLEKRLGDIKNRGVVIRPGQTLKELYQERRPLYEKYADIKRKKQQILYRPTAFFHFPILYRKRHKFFLYDVSCADFCCA